MTLIQLLKKLKMHLLTLRMQSQVLFLKKAHFQTFLMTQRIQAQTVKQILLQMHLKMLLRMQKMFLQTQMQQLMTLMKQSKDSKMLSTVLRIRLIKQQSKKLMMKSKLLIQQISHLKQSRRLKMQLQQQMHSIKTFLLQSRVMLML